MPGFEMPDGLVPQYVNQVRISHTLAELVFDFARFLPGETSSIVVERLLMSPVGAKLFLRALTDNLARYEANFGEITLPGDTNLAGDLFRSIHPPEPPKT